MGDRMAEMYDDDDDMDEKNVVVEAWMYYGDKNDKNNVVRNVFRYSNINDAFDRATFTVDGAYAGIFDDKENENRKCVGVEVAVNGKILGEVYKRDGRRYRKFYSAEFEHYFEHVFGGYIGYVD